MAQTKAGLAQSFDLDKYTIDNTPIEQTITIEETGDSFQITYKILSWAQRNKLIAKYISEGKSIVRLKGGDPMIFGRGGEELQFLSKKKPLISEGLSETVFLFYER